MKEFTQTRLSFKTIVYNATRILLGFYLLVHSINNIMQYNEFIDETLKYFSSDSPYLFLAYLTPIVPLIEFFLALLILLGLNTRKSLIAALIIGLAFTIFFIMVADTETAILHTVTMILKVGLLYFIYYNVYSVDYLNLKTAQRNAPI